METGLEIKALKKTYPRTGRRPAVDAVKGIDLDVRRGEVVGLLGPNGAGKTTVIKALCGLLRPTAGRILIGPYDLAREKRRALASMAVVLEGDRNLRFRLNLKENILFFTRLAGCDEARVRREMTGVLERFGLSDKIKDQVRNLSKGQKQKLSVAIAYLTKADLVLLDEPTLGLDVQSSHELQTVIREMASEGRAILLTTHEMAVAQRVADRVAIVNEGRLVTFQPMRELLELFRYRQYLIKVRYSSSRDLTRWEDDLLRAVDDDGDVVTFEASVNNKAGLYAALAELEREDCEILEIGRHQPDLEKIFLAVIAGEKERAA